MNKPIIINFLLFQIGWFGCVLAGAYGPALTGSLLAMIIIAYHLYHANHTMHELRLLIFALIIGLVFESIVTWQDLARYSHGQVFDIIAPLWMILMWPLFATTLNLSMRWLKSLAPLLIAIIGAIFAPLAYLAGSRIGAVEYNNIGLSLSIIAIAWATLLPALVSFSQKYNGYDDIATRPGNSEVTQRV